MKQTIQSLACCSTNMLVIPTGTVVYHVKQGLMYRRYDLNTMIVYGLAQAKFLTAYYS